MKTILIPLDGSILAEQALPYAKLLARLLEARVRLLHVLTELDREGIIASGVVSRRSEGGAVVSYPEIEQCAWETLCEQADIYLTSQAETLRAAELVVDTEVCKGIPHARIVEAAARESDTLILIATHGYGGLRRWALGSVADKVIQTATVPIFVVRSTSHMPPDEPALRRIMVPLDGSDMARCAILPAIELARSANAELMVLRAIVPHAHYAGLLLMQRNQAVQGLSALARDLRQQVVITPVVAVDHSDVAEAIVDEASQRHVDLIVMATHGHGGWQRWIPGSVADKVLHTTTTPLLLMRAPNEPA